MMRAARFVLAVSVALVGLGHAKASTIFYSESLTTDGNLGATAFTNKLVTLTFTAETTGATFFAGAGFTQYSNIPSVSTVTVAGVGGGTFTDAMLLSVYVYPTFSEFQDTDSVSSIDVLDIFGTASTFAGYNMQTPFGPVSGGAAYTTSAIYGTSAGNFQLTRTGGGVATFVATSGVPEPSSMLLMGAGLLGRIFLRRSYTLR